MCVCVDYVCELCVCVCRLCVYVCVDSVDCVCVFMYVHMYNICMYVCTICTYMTWCVCICMT